MEKIENYRLLCKLTSSSLRPYEKASPSQIIFTKQKIRLSLEKKGGNNMTHIIIIDDKK